LLNHFGAASCSLKMAFIWTEATKKPIASRKPMPLVWKGDNRRRGRCLPKSGNKPIVGRPHRLPKKRHAQADGVSDKNFLPLPTAFADRVLEVAL
jgi:hypothetical protein